jgi:hypothetical protein
LDELDLLAGVLLEGSDDLRDRPVFLRMRVTLPPHDEVGGARAERRHEEHPGQCDGSIAHNLTSSNPRPTVGRSHRSGNAEYISGLEGVLAWSAPIRFAWMPSQRDVEIRAALLARADRTTAFEGGRPWWRPRPEWRSSNADLRELLSALII